MPKKTKKQRLEDQRIRQAERRAKAGEMRRPDRDDLARVLLWKMIKSAQKQSRIDGHNGPMDALCALLVKGLAFQGFDPRQSEEVFAQLETRYRLQISLPRVKRHLNNPSRTESGDENDNR